jgi:hypothetical protein
LIDDLSAKLQKERLCAGSTCSPGTATDTNDDKPPTVSLLAPQTGTLVNGNVRFDANASDNLGVASVEFWQGSNLLVTDTTPPYETSWDASAEPTGTHDLHVVARDGTGNSSTAQISVDVENFDVQAANGASGTSGKIENGDTLTFNFDHPVDPGTIVDGWDGNFPLSTVVRLSPDDPAQSYNDTLDFPSAPSLGVVDLGQADFWGWRLSPFVTDNFDDSDLVLSPDQRSLTVTLGSGNPAGQSGGGGTMVWTAPGAVCSVAPTCRVTESGAPADVDF